MTIELLNDIISGCTKCFELPSSAKHVPGVGYGPKVILVVVTSSLCQDDTSKWPRLIDTKYVYLFDMLLKEIGLKPEQVYVTSCVKCPDGEGSECRTFLLDEIAAVAPKYVVTLGLQAFQLVTGLTDWIPGRECTSNKCKVIPMLGLDSVASNQKYEKYFLNSALSIKNTMEQPTLDWW